MCRAHAESPLRRRSAQHASSPDLEENRLVVFENECHLWPYRHPPAFLECDDFLRKASRFFHTVQYR
jgi:hypothetical protein